MKTTGNVRRRTLPVLVLALLLAGLPGVALAAPAVPKQGGVTVVRVWEWVRGWVAESLGLQPSSPTGEEGGGIDPNGRKSGSSLLGDEGGGIDPNG